MTELVRGHGNRKTFQLRIGDSEEPNCVRCEEESEDSPTHFLCECVTLAPISGLGACYWNQRELETSKS